MINFDFHSDTAELSFRISIKYKELFIYLYNIPRRIGLNLVKFVRYLRKLLPDVVETIKLLTAITLAIITLLGALIHLKSLIGL